MENLNLIIKKIKAARDILISGHINPDGDSIGSLLSLGLGLKSLNKRVYMLSQDEIPKRYSLLPGAKSIIKNFTKPVDLAISVDCSNKEILGKSYDVFTKAKDILEIDHHEFRRPFGNLEFIDSKASAVGELIYILLKNLKIPISKNIGHNLLTSIIVETDSFRLPNVRPFTFEVCTNLIKKNINFYKLVEMVFWSKSKESVLLTGICLARCKFIKNNRIVWSIIRKEDFNKIKGKDEDVDPVADEMRSIHEVEIAILFREKQKDEIRVSLRSKGKINVARIAESYNGGGHFDVAGCSIPNDPKSIRRLLKKAEELLSN
ncbi:MAG: DHH family phosphoesterase [Candidatus Omnitrophota bacterium]